MILMIMIIFLIFIHTSSIQTIKLCSIRLIFWQKYLVENFNGLGFFIYRIQSKWFNIWKRNRSIHQHLVLLIEKPHSLYFSTIYQFGLFGVLLLLLILGYLLIKFFLNKFHYVYLLGIYFFAIGIKSEFLFTHNQIVLFILFIFYCLFFEKEEINK